MRMDPNAVPVVELHESDARPPRRRAARLARLLVPAVVVALIGGGVIATARIAEGHTHRSTRIDTRPKSSRTDDEKQSRVAVESALAQTTAADNYEIRYRMSATGGMTISGRGTVSVQPLGIVTVAGVGGYGDITTRYDGTNVWESGGGDYGTTGAGTGAPLSAFAAYVLGTLGRRQGAVAMNSLATPTGYLALARESIMGASELGTGTVDGVGVTVYSVDVNWLHASNVQRTPQQAIAAAAADQSLVAEGYTGTAMRVSVDAEGFIRRTQTTVHFADGGTVDADTTFSGFGCSALVAGPHGPDFVPAPADCAKS